MLYYEGLIMVEVQQHNVTDSAAPRRVEGVDSVPLPMLDPCWYRAAYPDVARVALDPETHYHLYGQRLDRDPSPEFSTTFFRALLDVKQNNDPLRALRKLAMHGAVPKSAVDPGRVLWAAAALSERGQPERALVIAEQWLTAAQRYRANILRANLAVRRGDDAGWLAATNAYLEHFGVAPIHLQGVGSLFDRIQAGAIVPRASGPKVSVIVAAWNSERTVGKALASLLNQTWQNIELLVVDDCSSDSTWGIISEVASTDPRVKAWRNTENVGPYVSKSIAASYATGDWITCHDADDWAHPERIHRQVQFCTENRLTACLSGMLRIADNGEFTRLNPSGVFVHDGACRSAFISLFVSAQLFHDLLGAWDQVRAGGDSEFLRRLETVSGKKVRQLPVPTMLCRDHEGSLTNNLQYGLSARVEDGALSRTKYKKSYMEAHKKVNKRNSRYTLPIVERHFDAPRDLQVPIESVRRVASLHQPQLRQQIVADVVVVTNARFPGGNASSTLDELNYFRTLGLSVALVHCPVDSDVGRDISTRYNHYRDILYQWSQSARIDARVLICRHPRVLTSHAFRQISPNIRAKNAFVVQNNSSRRPGGESVYKIGDMVKAAYRLSVGRLEFCPISPAMRSELLEYSEERGETLCLSDLDWTPTFDPTLYFHAPKTRMDAPYKIGRHARDGTEKWRERSHELLQAYPPSDEFEIRILGGADKATSIIGVLPTNWHVQAFGEVEPLSYLAALDAFVYFPNSKLVEGFGRTVAEAMIAGVPAIVPRRLEEIFGDLPLYCEPRQVAGVVKRLAKDTGARIAYLEEVQRLVLARYGTDVIVERLRASGLRFPVRSAALGQEGLSATARRYRASILDGQ